jgi:hypothetical protein
MKSEAGVLLVALELKIGEFEPEYVGKMQFYL